MKKIQPLVSVVTPFHNEEHYLTECLESVLAQSYGNWEYIVVDNCSTDRSWEIVMGLAARDSRIKLERNDQLLPQVSNFNFALDHISPESVYCKIVQGDDTIYPDCLEQMVALAQSDKSIGIVSSYRKNGDVTDSPYLPEKKPVYEGREICRNTLLGGPFPFGSPTTVLYRSDIVRKRKPFYPLNRLHEDTEVCFEILEHHRFGFVHAILSYTRRENESISSVVRSFNPNLLDDYIILKKFGPVYLDKGEYLERISQLRGAYNTFLTYHLKSLTERDFWKYHRDGLSTIGERINYFNLFWIFVKRKIMNTFKLVCSAHT